MLLKGVAEVQMAPQPMTALEMLLVRLCYVAELPSPGDLVKSLDEGGGVSPAPPAAAPAGGNASRNGGGNGGARAYGGGGSRTDSQPYPDDAPPVPDTDHLTEAGPQPQSLLEVAALFKEKREVEIYTHILDDLHPVHFEAGRIEFRPRPEAPRNLANRMGDLLSQWTGRRWVVSVSGDEGQPTLHEQAKAEDAARKSEAAQDPLVQAVLDTFPGARIEAVRPLNTDADGAPPPAPDDDQDEDPS
jgi:DNA polymerase-3 subunit gamma/tau